MLYIFDQQKGLLAALGVTLDCVFSLLRQWTLRSPVGIRLPAASLGSSTPDHIPSFETLEPFQPRASAIVHGALLSLILFYVSVFSIRYSWMHVSNLHFPEIAAGGSPQPVEVIPAEPDGRQTKAMVSSSSPRTPAAPVPPRTVMILLDPYVGKYVSRYPPAKISIQIERDPLSGNHLSLSLAAAGHPRLALSPVSPTRFVIVGAKNGYVNFDADAQGRICSLSLVLNGKVITAQR